MLDYCQNKEDYNEGELYKILTEFMGAFRRFIKTSQHICKTISKPATYNQNISSLNSILSQIKTLANLQNYSSNPSPQHHVYLRFTARLFQIISLAKSNQPQSSNITSLYKEFIGKTEVLINNFKIKKNLSLLFNSVFHLSTNFYEGCSLIMKNGSIKQALQVLSKISQDQKPLSDSLLKREFDFSKKVQIASKPVLSQSQLKLFTINCMDVDCDYVTSMIFLANNKKEEVIRLMNERNKPISQIINNYYKQFHYHLRKIERNCSRSKFKQGKNINYTNFANNFKMKNKIKTIQTNPNIDLYQSSLRSTKVEKSVFFQGNLSYNNSPVKKSEVQESRQRIQYLNSFHPIKNTYLTFNNIEAQSVKNHRTPKNAYFKNIEDAKKIKCILKSCKLTLNSQKSQQNHQQTAILQIKKFNLNNQVERNNEKLLQLFSLASHQEQQKNAQSQKRQIMDKSRKIRNIRKSQMSKTFSKFNTSSPKQIISNSFRTKTQINVNQFALT